MSREAQVPGADSQSSSINAIALKGIKSPKSKVRICTVSGRHEQHWTSLASESHELGLTTAAKPRLNCNLLQNVVVGFLPLMCAGVTIIAEVSVFVNEERGGEREKKKSPPRIYDLIAVIKRGEQKEQ